MELDMETRANSIRHCKFRFRKRIFELARPEKGSRRPSDYFTSPENVLILYDGSVSALALLHLIRDTLLSSGTSSFENTSEQKCYPLPFTFSIVFIYDQVGGSKEVMTKELDLLRTWQAETWLKFGLDFPIVLSSLESSLLLINEYTEGKSKLWRTISASNERDSTIDCADGREGDTTELDESLPFDTTLNSRLTSIADTIKSQTCREDFLLQMRQNLLVFIGQKLNVKKIIVAENQTSMAVKMFSIMSLGRGAQLAEQMSFITQIEGVKLARPLMDLPQDDLQDYIKCIQGDGDQKCSSTQVPPSTDRDVNTKKVIKGKTIESQCEEFIVDLQKGYPSTVPTLTRIGFKLQPSSLLSHSHSSSSPVDVNYEGTGDNSSLSSKCRFCKRNREPSSGGEQESFSMCCYGCTNILRDMKDQSLFTDLIHP